MSEGLNLFDEKASAAGGFPIVFRGYDRDSVDGYISELEESVAQLKLQLREANERVNDAEHEIEYASTQGPLSSIGTEAVDVLRIAEAKAAELMRGAMAEAGRIRREAADKAAAATLTLEEEGNRLREEHRAQVDHWRKRSAEDAEKELNAAKGAGTAAVAAARSQADELLRQAKQEALAVTEGAQLEAAEALALANAEAARIRQELNTQRAQTLAQLRTEHDEAHTAIRKLVEQAESIAESSSSKVADTGMECAQLRHSAHADADKIRSEARREAERLLLQTQQEMTTKMARMEHEMSTREEQIRQKISALEGRRLALQGQLSALADFATSARVQADALHSVDVPEQGSPQAVHDDSQPTDEIPQMDEAHEDTEEIPVTSAAPDATDVDPPSPDANKAPEPHKADADDVVAETAKPTSTPPAPSKAPAKEQAPAEEPGATQQMPAVEEDHQATRKLPAVAAQEAATQELPATKVDSTPTQELPTATESTAEEDEKEVPANVEAKPAPTTAAKATALPKASARTAPATAEAEAQEAATQEMPAADAPEKPALPPLIKPTPHQR